MNYERAAIMATTYCIGFMTAFIAYGLAEPETAPVAIVPALDMPAAAIVAKPPTPLPTAVSSGVSGVYTALEVDGLYLHTGTSSTLIAVPKSLDPAFATVGYESVLYSLPRPDAVYVFFCATYTADTEGCSPRVFDTTANTIHIVQKAAEPVVIDAATLKAAWVSDGRIQINNFVSVNPTTPWIVE